MSVSCFSFVQFCFQFMVAMLLTHQPFYIGGIEDVAGATRNAYGAMGTFLCTFILSVVYLVQDVLKGGSRRGARNAPGLYSDSRRRSGHDYDGVPTNMMKSTPTIAAGKPSLVGKKMPTS